MEEKLHHLKLIFSVKAIAFVVAFFILTTQTSAITVRPQVAAGASHTVGLKSDGTVVAVGDNGFGQLNVSSWKDIVQVAAGRRHTIGVKSGGTVVTVGDNRYGQLNVGSWKAIVQVAAGRYHTVGLKSDGSVVAVGSNNAGQCDVSNWNLGPNKGKGS